ESWPSATANGTESRAFDQSFLKYVELVLAGGGVMNLEVVNLEPVTGYGSSSSLLPSAELKLIA
ncbi:MAG TPA: hypothetical protein VF251_11120, partial [Pyrinomonadaceae bacterium]